ncbi:MAG TPA: DUF2937 family protein [Steroidobacteraceae bacterium]|nr:DUF2937 family protein [Steroidobacteraceae bacterium]
MSLLRGLLDRLLLLCAVVAGGLVPGFIAQYRQRLGGRLDQARLDLAPWRQLAQQYYQDDIQRLIANHLASSDPAIRAEGAIIRTLVATVEQLQSAMDALHGSLFRQAGYLTLHADPALVRATLHDWVPTFALSADGILFALVFALVVWLMFQAAWQVLAWLGSRRRGLYSHDDRPARRLHRAR